MKRSVDEGSLVTDRSHTHVDSFGYNPKCYLEDHSRLHYMVIVGNSNTYTSGGARVVTTSEMLT